MAVLCSWILFYHLLSLCSFWSNEITDKGAGALAGALQVNQSLQKLMWVLFMLIANVDVSMKLTWCCFVASCKLLAKQVFACSDKLLTTKINQMVFIGIHLKVLLLSFYAYLEVTTIENLCNPVFSSTLNLQATIVRNDEKQLSLNAFVINWE